MYFTIAMEFQNWLAAISRADDLRGGRRVGRVSGWIRSTGGGAMLKENK